MDIEEFYAFCFFAGCLFCFMCFIACCVYGIPGGAMVFGFLLGCAVIYLWVSAAFY